jgi:hypothetical protein
MTVNFVVISRQPSPIKIMVDQKQLQNVESFKYLGSILTNDAYILVKLNVRGLFLLAHWT